MKGRDLNQSPPVRVVACQRVGVERELVCCGKYFFIVAMFCCDVNAGVLLNPAVALSLHFVTVGDGALMASREKPLDSAMFKEIIGVNELRLDDDYECSYESVSDDEDNEEKQLQRQDSYIKAQIPDRRVGNILSEGTCALTVGLATSLLRWLLLLRCALAF